MKNLLVIGGTGFLGTNLIQKLSQTYKVTCLTTHKHKFREPIANVEYLFEDWRHFEFRSLCETKQFEAVFLLSNSSHPRTANNRIFEDFDHNVKPSIRCLDQIYSVSTPRLIFASSGGATYMGSSDSVSESSDLNLSTAYSVSKVAIESYLSAFASIKKATCIALRISNPYGPHQDPNGHNGVISIFLQNIQLRKPISLFGDGNTTKDFIFVDDVVEAMELCVASDKLRGFEVINIGSGIGTTLNAVITDIESVTSLKADIRRQPSISAEPNSTILNIEKAQDILNWSCASSLRASLEKTLCWQEDNIINHREP